MPTWSQVADSLNFSSGCENVTPAFARCDWRAMAVECIAPMDIIRAITSAVCGANKVAAMNAGWFDLGFTADASAHWWESRFGQRPTAFLASHRFKFHFNPEM